MTEKNYKEDFELDLEDLDDEETELGKDVNEDEDIFPKLELSKVKGINFKTKPIIATNKKAADIRIVNTKKNGKRIILKKNLIEAMDNPDELEFGFLDDTLIIGRGNTKKISDTSYSLKPKGKNTYCIYNSGLVEEITKRLKLDFTNTSTVNLKYIKYEEVEEETIAMARA